MAKNSIGEVESRPGANARESAYYAGQLAKSHAKAAKTLYGHAEVHDHNAGIYAARRRMVYEFPNSEKKWGTTSQNACLQREEQTKANKHFEEASKHARQARIARKQERRDNLVAFMRTVGAKLGFNISG